MSVSKWFSGVVVVLGTVLSVQAAGDDAYLVKIKGLDKTEQAQVMTVAEYKAFDATIKVEQKLFSQAVATATKEWRADEFNKGIPFAGNKLMARRIISATKYPSSEKASDALTKYEDMQAKKEEREFKKKTSKSKEQLKLEGEIMTASGIVQKKLDELVAKGPAAGADAKGAAAGGEAPGGAKVNAALEKAIK